MKRRDFLQNLALAGTVSALAPRTPAAPPPPAGRPRILLREALQFENIGDSGRVPGTIRLFYEHLPEAEVFLWPWNLHIRERQMLERAFPKLRVVEGEINSQGRPTTPALADAWEKADIFVSASKNAVTYRDWAKTGRPYGLFGVAFDPITDRRTRPDGATLDELRAAIDQLPAGDFDRKWGSRDLYERAAFIYCRDTLSLRYLRQQKLQPPILAFGPEGCFAIGVRDDRRAETWLRRQGLTESEFICVVPRLRYTPYYRVRNLPREESDYAIDELNERSASRDHAPLREMILLWVKQTGGKVVACPEMTYEIQTAREQLVEPLREEIRHHLVWRDAYWLADEAAAVYAQAVAVVSAECHSPIIALANDTPAFYVRQPVDTVKGQMFRDLGLGDWVFEGPQTSGEDLWRRLRAVYDDRSAARAKVREVKERVAERQRTMVEAIGRAAAAAK